MSEPPEVIQELHESLVQVVSACRGGVPEGRDLAALVRRIDELRHYLEGGARPMLRHYLDRRSYAKALVFLEGRDGQTKPGC